MSPDEVKAIRKRLKLTARDLGAELGLGSDTILGWEKGELFPTKRYVDQLRSLDAKGPVPRVSKQASPLELLAAPEVWCLVRKILAHPDLRKKVEAIASDFDDPAQRDKSAR